MFLLTLLINIGEEQVWKIEKSKKNHELSLFI